MSKPYAVIEANGRKMEWRDGELVLTDGTHIESIPNCSGRDASAIGPRFLRTGDCKWRPPHGYHERLDRENEEYWLRLEAAKGKP